MEVQALAAALRENIARVIHGKDDVIDRVILCALADGHILLEDMPGTGKTTLVKALAKSLGLTFRRIQFTPDLLPSDVTGVHYFDGKNFVFRAGPVFTNILLADEINRATPRTQSSLLECMEERQVTVDGETRALQAPFLVAATQNPIEIQGTFPLPEAQLDRFLMRLSVGYPDGESELAMLGSKAREDPLDTLAPVVTREELLAAQQAVREVAVSDAVKQYLLAVVAATRTHERVRLGVSPRGSLALQRAAQACAAMRGGAYVLPDDVKHVAEDVLCHRILLKAAGRSQRTEAAQLVRDILATVPVPN